MPVISEICSRPLFLSFSLSLSLSISLSLFETLQQKTEKDIPNDEYENFVNAHLEATEECIPTKPRTKHRVPWETLAAREKRANVKTASKSYRKSQKNTNAIKRKKGTRSISRNISERTDRIHTKSNA